jgi:hypothetical protein
LLLFSIPEMVGSTKVVSSECVRKKEQLTEGTELIRHGQIATDRHCLITAVRLFQQYKHMIEYGTIEELNDG